MGVKYQVVQWNRTKIIYDVCLLIGAGLYLAIFMVIGLQAHESGNVADPVILLIRALGTLAFAMLTIILAIGPLARMTPRFLPLLYNRRHFGVLTFLVASAHFGLSLMWYHGAGELNPLVSIFISGQEAVPLGGIPFEVYGLIAFVILAVMAFTSHDFWLHNLSASTWKFIHMTVYFAYGLLVFHIVLGALLTERSWLYPILTGSALGGISILHLLAGRHESSIDNAPVKMQNEGWVRVGRVDEIPMARAKTVMVRGGDRVAVFRDGNTFRAVTNVCKHQGGPLGEGKILDGCVTCPWHGFQFKLVDGVAPAPYTEKIATYNVKLEDGFIFVFHKPNALGEKSDGITLGSGTSFEEGA